MIGHLELAIATLTSHASWAWLIKICLLSQIFLRCIRAELDLIMNARINWSDRSDFWLWMQPMAKNILSHQARGHHFFIG